MPVVSAELEVLSEIRGTLEAVHLLDAELAAIGVQGTIARVDPVSEVSVVQPIVGRLEVI